MLNFARTRQFGLAMAIALSAVVASMAAAVARFEPPGENADAAEIFNKSVRPQVQQGRFADAAEPLDKLFAPQPGGLLVLDEGGLVSAAAWLETLPAPQRQALAAEYRRLFDAPAKEALEALKQRPAATAEQFHQLSQRYPLSSVAATAYLESAERAYQSGDAAAAAAFFDCAERSGWKPDGERALMAAVARVTAGRAMGSVPAELAARAAVASAKLRGPESLLLDGSWYQGGVRDWPATAGGMIYLAGPKDVLAVRENGEVVWRWTASNRVGDWAGQVSAEAYKPSIFAGAGGAQVLVVRQPRSTGNDFCLRAFRAADGKLLWSSEDNPGMDRLNVAGRAAVAGRYVYAAGVQWNDDSGVLVLLAFDLLDGRLIFTSPLGTLVDRSRWRLDRSSLEELYDQSAPAVAGDAVYLTPKAGVAWCVGRFGGQIRWTRVYEDPAVGRVWRDPRSAAPRGGRRGDGPAATAARRLRFSGTPRVCGRIVVIAPQDAPVMMGLDAATGQVRWSSSTLPGHTLCAATDTAAIFVAGNAVEALDPATGQSKWRYGPGSGQAAVAGPPTVAGSALFLPTLDGLTHFLNPQTGASVAPDARPVGLRQILAVPATKKAMEESGLLRR
jgi:outer membrane protein assembly factor BamB